MSPAQAALAAAQPGLVAVAVAVDPAAACNCALPAPAHAQQPRTRSPRSWRTSALALCPSLELSCAGLPMYSRHQRVRSSYTCPPPPPRPTAPPERPLPVGVFSGILSLPAFHRASMTRACTRTYTAYVPSNRRIITPRNLRFSAF
ncbi:hypothetical protein BD310DRAFT_42795 [Dichomitus squalens]|uniref:Uncharacterized protein n=1 Tax=Dichomitus squalens TaxID=114155 RepID=A0A4Q9QEF8_9APHY|nr:hypothetical protein BD310DRAFT_42795 [Dichomitus squalens]